MSGLYIHIPFCESKCAYCDFYSILRHDHIDEYINALHTEYDERRHELTEPVRTIYIGGGTPSILTLPQLDRLIKLFSDINPIEFTIEVNPEHITSEYSKYIASSPVNRVSIGIQSLCDAELSAISRRHNAACAVSAAETLRNAGITNLSLDLIFGLPHQSIESWTNTLNRAIALKPEHLSAYSLMYEPGTKLSAMLSTGKIRETPQEISEAMYHELCHVTASAGYEHYEISNFAIPGKRSCHNSSYWTFTPYLGLGAAAHSFDGKIRRYNPSNIKKYLAAPEHAFMTEEITQSQTINEYLMVRLRTIEGLDTGTFQSRFGNEALNRILVSAKPYLQSGKLVLTDNGILSIPPDHWLISDSILVDLFVD